MRKIVIDEQTLQLDLTGGMILPSGDDLPYSDGIPLETPWHRDGMMLMMDQVDYQLQGRKDYFVGGDMFVHFSLKKDKRSDFRGPDLFVVFDVPKDKRRKSWVVWEEDWHYPDIVVELLSESTASIDRNEKFELYQDVWKTTEYYLFDFDSMLAEGWRLIDGKYRAIEPDSSGRIECKQLGMWLGGADIEWRGESRSLPTFYLKDGQLAPTFYLGEKSRADAETERAEVEKQRAEVEKQRADAEAAKNQALLVELQLLRNKLNNTGTTDAK